MKIGVGKRILMFLHWLFSILICAALVLAIFFPYVLVAAENFLMNLMGPFRHVGMIVLGVFIALVYAILCIVQASIIFKRKPRMERGFITIDSSDNSRVRIAISAIEQMVRQSVHNIDGISDMKIAISSADDAIEINIKAGIIAGRHVPTITLNMQQAIRRFVEMNCGVAVRTVEVSIHSVTSADGSKKKRRTGNAEKEPVYDIPAAAVPTDIAVEPVEELAETAAEIVCAEDDVAFEAHEEPVFDTAADAEEPDACISEEEIPSEFAAEEESEKQA